MAEKAKGTTTPAPPAPATNDALKGALVSASEQAASVAKRERPGTVIAGPFPVGNMGNVSVVERESQKGDHKYTFAEYQSASGGRIKSIPLAAVAALHEELG